MSSPQKRKEQKNTGYTAAQNGTKSDEIFPTFSRSWSKKREPQRSGSDQEVLLCSLSGKAGGTGSHQHEKMGNLRSTKAGPCQQKASRDTLPRIAPCW